MLSISEKLKKARLAANLTQEELAEKIGVSRQTISNWENGRSYPDVVSIIVLSDIYNMTLDSLLKGDSDMIKHLKNSTDVTKSNKQVVAGLVIFGAMVVIGFLISDFVSVFPTGLIVVNIIVSLGLIAAAITVITKFIDRIKRTELKASNKTLMKTGVLVLTILFYGLFLFSLWSY